MANHWKQEMSFQVDVQSESYVKMPVSARCYIPTLLPQEQAANTNMVSVVRTGAAEVLRPLRPWPYQ